LSAYYSASCRDCPRLAKFLAEVRVAHPDYHALPVAPFGDEHPRLLIVGLAPGMHGANRSGRPFTGDFAGIILYQTLHKFGFASAPVSVALDDGLRLLDCRISNAVKCLPPENKPERDEINRCNHYLASEIAAFPDLEAILALGLIAHEAVLLAHGLKRSAHKFAHGAMHTLPNGKILFDSYHCSRYNTNTRRLTTPMFEQVFTAVRKKIGGKLAAPAAA
jgi:uracil-DNA glycosylase family 4